MRSRPNDIFGFPALSLEGCGSGVWLTSPSFNDGTFMLGCIGGCVLSILTSSSASSFFYIAFRFRPSPMLWTGCPVVVLRTFPKFNFIFGYSFGGYFYSSWTSFLWIRPVFGSFTSSSFWIRLLWPSLPKPPRLGMNGFFWAYFWGWTTYGYSLLLEFELTVGEF